jgi:hypothetical protein
MADARAKFNDKTDPSYQFENQCTAFRSLCPNCGNKFPSGSRECPECGATRPRCQNKVVKGEVVCRSHMKGRNISLYNKLAATISDTELEEIIEADDHDLSQEFALARICISGALDDPSAYSSKQILAMLKDFFTIAEKKKNIEQGQVLNISWNDDLVNSLRARVRKLIRTFSEIIEENVTDEDLKKQMLEDLYNRTKLNGNMISCPPKASDYVQPEGSREIIQEKIDQINKDFAGEDDE